MLCRSVLTAIAISCTFSSEIKAYAHDLGAQRLGQIKDILCVLLLSGLQKEDMDVNTLKKLERHNVNIHDMNNETLRHECLGHTTLEMGTMSSDTSEDITTVNTGITDASYDSTTVTKIPETPDSILHPKNSGESEVEKAINKELLLGSNIKKENNVIGTKDIEQTHFSQVLTTLQGMFNYWKKNNDTTRLNIDTESPITSPSTSENSKAYSNIPMHSNEFMFIKKLLGQFMANHTTKVGLTTPEYNHASQKSTVAKNNLELQELPGINKNVAQILYNVETPNKAKPENSSTVETPQNAQLAIDAIGLMESITNIKNGFTDTDMRNMLLNKLKNNPHHKEVLVKEPPQKNMNTNNLNKSIPPAPLNDKRQLNDLISRILDSRTIDRLEGMTNLFPSLTDTGHSLHMAADKSRIYNDKLMGAPKDLQNIPKFEDWFSNMFKNIEISPHNDQNQLPKVFLYDATYSSNNNKKPVEFSEESSYLAYTPIMENYKLKTQPTVAYIESNNDLYDINALFSNYYKVTERSKSMLFPELNSNVKTFSSNFLSASPLRTNYENYVPRFESNQYNIKKKVETTHILKNNPISIRLNSENIQRRNNEENMMAKNYPGNERDQFDDNQEVLFSPNIKPTPDGFSKPLKSSLEENNNNKYINALKDIYQRNNQSFAPHVNDAKVTEKTNVENETITLLKMIPILLENLKHKQIKQQHEISEAPVRNENQKYNDIKEKSESLKNNEYVISENRSDIQYNPKVDQYVKLKDDQLRHIKQSLEFINQIIANNTEIGLSRPSIATTTTSDKTVNINQNKYKVVKRKNKNITKIKILTNHYSERQPMPTDFIKQIAESVKNIILKDINIHLTPTTPIISTTALTTSTRMTTEKAAAVPNIQDTHADKDTSYAVHKILELLEQLKFAKETTTTTASQNLVEKNRMKTEFPESQDNHSSSIHVFNSYGINLSPDIHRNDYNYVTTSYNRGYKNPLNVSSGVSLQQLNRQSQIINHPMELTNQQTSNAAFQNVYQYPQIINRHLQLSYDPMRMPYPPLQIINQPPVMTNPILQNIYRLPQISNREAHSLNPQSEMVYQAPLIQNNSPETMLTAKPQRSSNIEQYVDNPQQMISPVLQMNNQPPQVINTKVQPGSKASNRVNHAQLVLNQALQSKKQPQLMIYDSPEMLIQSLQGGNHPQQILHEVPPIQTQSRTVNDNSPEILTPLWRNFIRGRQIKTQQPRMTNDSPETFNPQSKTSKDLPQVRVHTLDAIGPVSQIIKPETNRFQQPLTLQTNLNEIPPLAIPMDQPKGMFNQLVVVTTKNPFDKFKDEHEVQKWSNENRKGREQYYADLIKKLRLTESLKREEYKDPYRNRTSNYRTSPNYKHFFHDDHEAYKSRYRSLDYDRSHPRQDLKTFREQLERPEERFLDRKKSVAKDKQSCNDVPSRQQEPLTKQRSRYDDTHFRNFLKTQEKVNAMLEAILATKTNSDRLRSVESP